jgi:hypothetical protein
VGRYNKPQKVIMEGENKTAIVNNNRDLPVIPGELTKKEASREELLIRNLFLDMDLKPAARAAGYSESYISSTLYQKFKSPKFQARIRDYASALNYSFLPKVLNIHKLGLQAIEDDLKSGGVEKASKLKHFTRQTLQMGGLLNDEVKPGVSYVNIQNLQAIITDKITKGLDDDSEGED